jgi:hypothetical protein
VRLFAADTASQMGDLAAAIACLDALPPSASDYARVLKKARLLFADGRRADALRQVREAAAG